jgi:hypothetical protein
MLVNWHKKTDIMQCTTIDEDIACRSNPTSFSSLTAFMNKKHSYRSEDTLAQKRCEIQAEGRCDGNKEKGGRKNR